MATTRIMPLHIGKGRTESQAVSDIIDYVSNPQKTDNGRLVTGFACDSRVADAEFLLAKREYISTTGRVRGADDVLAYHVRQSFVPGEITPEEANRLGVEFAKRFTKGNHAFVVCTHIDKSHIHNHIIWNAVNLNCDRKFRNFWGSTRAVRRLNDTICVENGYSIVEDPKPHGKSYNKWLGDRAKPSHREQLRMMNNTEENKVANMNVQVGDVVFSATLEENEALSALVEMMQERPVVIQMSDYSGFEKVGPLGASLPVNNSQTTTRAGDIVLYNGSQIVIFYGSIVNDIKNFVFGPAKAPVYGFGRNRKQKFVMSFTIIPGATRDWGILMI